MTWPTIATDGIVVGNLEFLGDYWTWEAHREERYRKEPATIIQIEEEARWRKYNIKGSRGVATLPLRRELITSANHVLGFAEQTPLEGKKVTAYYLENRLMGISKAE